MADDWGLWLETGPFASGASQASAEWLETGRFESHEAVGRHFGRGCLADYILCVVVETSSCQVQKRV